MQTSQLSFFDDPPSGSMTPRALAVHPEPGRPLSKGQRTFNRLVGKVERLRTRLEDERRRMEAALVFHAEHLRPRIQRVVGMRKDLIRALQPFLQDRRLGRRDRQSLRDLIDHLGDALARLTGPHAWQDARAVMRERRATARARY